MTYQDWLNIINAGNAQTWAGNPTPWGSNADPITAYMVDPNNPLAGYAQRGEDGSVYGWSPVETGGGNFYNYDPSGNLINSGFSQNTRDWRDSLMGAVGTLGGAALLGNAGALLGGATGGATGAGTATAGAAAPAAATGAGAVAPTAGAAATAAGAGGMVNGGFLGEGMASGVPEWDRVAAAAGLPLATTAGGINWSSLLGQGASSLLSNPALLATGLGALAGVAGNDDMNVGTTSASSGTQQQTGNTSQFTTSNQTGNTQSSNTQSLAPWLQQYAQDYLGRAQSLAGGPMSNATMDAGRGLLAGVAQQGDPLVNAARAQQQSLIGGGMLNANPFIDKVAAGIADRMGEGYATGTRANLDSSFMLSGNDPRSSSAYRQTVGNSDRAFGDSLAQAMSGLYMNNYQNERAAQDTASRASLGFGQFGVQNAQNLYGMGAQDWQRPFFANQQFGAAINPAFGSQTFGNTASTQQGAQNMTGTSSMNGFTTANGTQNQNITAPNAWLSGLGGAAMGAGLYRSIFG